MERRVGRNDVRQVIVALEFLIKREFDPVRRHALQQKLDHYREELHSMELGAVVNE